MKNEYTGADGGRTDVPGVCIIVTRDYRMIWCRRLLYYTDLQTYKSCDVIVVFK
jgi:hypothetical protein